MQQEQVRELIQRVAANFRKEVDDLKATVQSLTQDTQTVEYTDQTYDLSIACDLSLEVVKSVPEFDGNPQTYVAWRQAVSNAIKPFLQYQNSLRLFQASCVIRNKITNSANNLLANHGTPLNIDAIIARLDFAYSDKRPIHVIEQEMSVLKQGKDSILTFYNKVNQKLTLLINKNIMTYGDRSIETKILNAKARENALRIFITGLHAPFSSIVFSLNPKDLPTALAQTEEIISNQERYNFAMAHDNRNRNNRGQQPLYNNYQRKVFPNTSYFQQFPQAVPNFQQFPQNSNNFQQFPQNEPNFAAQNSGMQQQRPLPPVEPMDVDPTQSNFRQNNSFRNNTQFNRQNYKRSASRNNSFNNNKFQRINNIQDEQLHFLG